MKKILLIFSIILLVIPNVIAGFGGGNPGSTSASAGGAMSSGGGVAGVQDEVTAILGEGDYRRFEVLGQSYTLKVTDVDNMYVWISITPTGIIQKVNIGATRRFDLNGNGLEDFLIQYRRNMDNKALLVYSIVSENVVEQTEPIAQVVKSVEKKQEIKPITVEQVERSNLNSYIIPIIVIALIIFGAYWYKENWNINKPKEKQKKIRLK